MDICLALGLCWVFDELFVSASTSWSYPVKHITNRQTTTGTTTTSALLQQRHALPMTSRVPPNRAALDRIVGAVWVGPGLDMDPRYWLKLCIKCSMLVLVAIKTNTRTQKCIFVSCLSLLFVCCLFVFRNFTKFLFMRYNFFVLCLI